MSSPIIARADALMHKRRPSSPEPDDIPVLTDAIDQDGEPPVLLVKESGEVAEASSATIPPGTDSGADSEMLDVLADELARRVHARLAAELPGILEDSIRDFLAEPEILARLRPRD